MVCINGRVDVCCTLEDAWALFCRFSEVAALIPTVEDIEVDGDRVSARMATKLGVLPVTSRIALEVVERKPYACLKARGLSYLGETIREQVAPGKAISGIAPDSVGEMFLHLDLRPGDDGRVIVLYHAEVEAQGRLKRIYRSILNSKAPAMMAEFGHNLRTALEAATKTPAAAEIQAEVKAPGAAEAHAVPDAEADAEADAALATAPARRERTSPLVAAFAPAALLWCRLWARLRLWLVGRFGPSRRTP
jgi:carbon monoxide dehydrogenase subunit G